MDTVVARRRSVCPKRHYSNCTHLCAFFAHDLFQRVAFHLRHFQHSRHNVLILADFPLSNNRSVSNVFKLLQTVATFCANLLKQTNKTKPLSACVAKHRLTVRLLDDVIRKTALHNVQIGIWIRRGRLV